MDIFLNIKTIHYKTNIVEKGQQHLKYNDDKYLDEGDCLDKKMALKGPKHELFAFFYTIQACMGR